jgi:hypothetical protein
MLVSDIFFIRTKYAECSFLSYICLSVTEFKIHRKERVAILTIHFSIKSNRQLIRFYQIKIRKPVNFGHLQF